MADPMKPEATKPVVAAAGNDPILPSYWEGGGNDVLARADNLDPDLHFYWVRKSPHNMQQKLYQGFKPMEFNKADPADMARLARYGFDPVLLNAANRIQWQDTELWFMTRARYDAIRKSLNTRLATKSSSVRATIEAEAADTAGRSRNRVIPFVSSGTPGEDLFDRTAVTESSARAGKTK